MTARHIPARDVRQHKGHGLRPIECDEPADRTDETEIQIAPAHTVRERYGADKFRQQFCEQPCRLRPLLMDGSINIAVPLNECRRIDSLPACKPFARLRQVPRRIKGDGDRGPARLRTDIFLPLGKSRHDERRTARRADGTQILIGKPLITELLARQAFQIREKMRHDMGRNFLCSDFKQKILAHFLPSFFSIG